MDTWNWNRNLGWRDNLEALWCVRSERGINNNNNNNNFPLICNLISLESGNKSAKILERVLGNNFLSTFLTNYLSLHKLKKQLQSFCVKTYCLKSSMYFFCSLEHDLSYFDSLTSQFLFILLFVPNIMFKHNFLFHRQSELQVVFW